MYIILTRWRDRRTCGQRFAVRQSGMSEILQRPEARLVILAALVAVVVAVGIYVVAKVRRTFVESGPSANDLITNFRELHSQGELSDEEYRTIKAMLAARLQQQLKGRSHEG